MNFERMHNIRDILYKIGRDSPAKTIKMNNTLWNFIVLSLFIMFILTPFSINCQNTGNSIKDSSVHIKLPDGLYLFQPYRETRDILFGRKDKDTISPLFIVTNGKLVDPITLTRRISVSKFLNTYVKDKAFNVFTDSEMIGAITNINLKPLETCHTKEFVPDLEGKGIYIGKKLESYGGRGVFIAPQSFNVSKTNSLFEVTDEDKEKVNDAIRKYLAPGAFEHLNQILARENKKIIREGKSKIERVDAVDLDGNGKKDFLGIYLCHAQSGPRAFSLIEFIFVFWDSGKIERINFGESNPSFIWGGIIDIDQDGKKEIIVQTLRSGDEQEGIDSGKVIEIYRHTVSGWTRVYQSAPIGCIP